MPPLIRSLRAFLLSSLLVSGLSLSPPLLLSSSGSFLAHATSATLEDNVDRAKFRVSTIFLEVRRGVLYICGIVIFACGVAGLTGRMPWKWFWTVGGCMFLIGVAFVVLDQILDEDVGENLDKASIFGSM